MSEIRRSFRRAPQPCDEASVDKFTCVVGPLVTTQPEKCFPVVFTFPSVEVKLLSLEEIALNCLYVGVKKTSGKTVLGAYVIWTKGLNRGHQTLES